jgi:hypothetical protein
MSLLAVCFGCLYPFAMKLSLPTEVISSHSDSTLGHLHLEWSPQPGAYIECEGQTYLVLERKHCYSLRSGRYQLHKIALYVQAFDAPTEGSLVGDRSMIGDTTCLYNARSELLRCAINPNGPCDRCTHYQAIRSQTN